MIREMLVDEATIMGLGDGGAHVCTVCDAGSPTFLLTHWARDRKRGPGCRWISGAQADAPDRARLWAEGSRRAGGGYKADINVIDFERLRLLKPEVVYVRPPAESADAARRRAIGTRSSPGARRCATTSIRGAAGKLLR